MAEQTLEDVCKLAKLLEERLERVEQWLRDLEGETEGHSNSLHSLEDQANRLADFDRHMEELLREMKR